MTNSEINGQENLIPDKKNEELDRYKEINLLDYLSLLWKRKYFIFIVSVLPVLIAWIIFSFEEQNYQITYVYDVESLDDAAMGGIDEKNYNLLLGKFYSAENSGKLTDKLQKDGLKDYARQIKSNNSILSQFVTFKTYPHFLDAIRLNSLDLQQLDKIRSAKVSLLNVTIIGRPKQDMYKISAVIRSNIEEMILLYIVREQLSVCIKNYNKRLVDIEDTRLRLRLDLDNVNGILAAVRKANAENPGEKPDNIVLQFNIGEQSKYLPLSGQIQTPESEMIEPEGNVKASEKNYKYYKDLIDLNNKILAELNNKLSSNYTVEQLVSFLKSLMNIYEKPQLKEYLNSYIGKLENRMLVNKPVIEKPEIYSVAKGTEKKSGIVFAASLIIAVFSAFLLESVDKSKSQ